MAPAPKTEEEKSQLIEKLREKVSTYILDEFWKSDVYLFKWLEDKNYNVDRAEKGLRKYIKWRIDNDIDAILEEDMGDLHTNFVYFMDGVDKDGRPIVSVPCNACNMKGAIEAGNKDKLIRFMRQMVEKQAASIRTAYLENPNVPTTFVVVADFQGVDVSKATPQVINFVISTATSCEDNYPGAIEAVYIINASKALKNLYAVIRPALRRKTTETIKIFSNKKHKWEPAVLSNIEPDQLRPRFGGTMEDTSGYLPDVPPVTLEIDLDKLKIEEKEKKAKK